MNTKFELNIGLENNPFTGPQVWGILCNQPAFMGTVQSREDVSTYEGETERTLVVKGLLRDEFNIVDVIEPSCKIMNQECIAVKLIVTDSETGRSIEANHLIYNPLFEGEKQEFSDEFFIRFSQLDDALNKVNLEMLKELSYGDEVELNSKYTLYHYVEDDKITLVETEPWEEVFDVMYDEDGNIEFESLTNEIPND